ncbi:PqiC family protein [Pseudoalteromonas rubra]|uniref:PqiC family protein n=1 Tax=Pseudoalteromonas rubra TaxID=43658 RepID=UPI002DB8671C|nr:ABC-type transport auxiliary lipoprotein family protein [Pseudoalteromonas rubra]MEC4088969.1 ABC-type transport auxiliary lipoprotein family protein [Pseudoalteromonas rubra]
MRAVIALLAIILTGCAGSDPAQYQYYRFDSAFDTKPSTGISASRVYVDEVNIVGVADQQALVQYTSAHTVHIANYHYWAEHPKLILTKETLKYLENKGLSPVLSAHASEFNTGDFKLLIEVSDLAGHYQQGAILKGAWHLYQITDNGTKLLRVKHFDYQSALSQDGFSALISAHQANWQLLMAQLHTDIGSSDIISPAD